MTTAPSNPNQAQGLTPDGLVNQLFDAALMHSTSKNPREIAQQVIDFVGAALFYALTASKRDVVVYLTETLSYVVSASSVDEGARQEMLKKVGETIISSPPLPGSNPPASGAKP